MYKELKMKVMERLVMRKAWEGFREVLDASVQPGSGGIALIGDSITHLGRWEQLLPGTGVCNFGIGGERSDHILARLDPVIRMQPRAVFLLIGTNDLGFGHRVEVIAQRVDQILVRLSSALPECHLHLQAVMPRQQEFAERIRQLNLRYEAIAQQRGAAFIPLFPLFADEHGTIRSELSGDGLHLSGAGYRVWREELIRWIQPA